MFLVDIGLPNGVTVRDVTVAECRLSDDVDVLIGMDIITMGDFIITNIARRTRFSFQMPSRVDMDRVLDNPE